MISLNVSPARFLSAAAAILASSAPLATHGQSFTRLEELGTVFGVVSTSEGAVVNGATTVSDSDDSPAVVRWTQHGGAVPVGVPSLDEGRFSPQSVSADGSVVVGLVYAQHSSRPSAYRWSASSGFQELAFNIRDDQIQMRNVVSADGSVVTGFGSSAAYRWDQQTGTVQIGGSLNDESEPVFRPHALSADGSVIVGATTLHPVFDSGEAALWTEATGAQPLGLESGSVAYGVSADGSVIVGNSGMGQAFRWTEAGGAVELGVLAEGKYSFATGISGEGGLIFGESGWIEYPELPEPFLWTLESGMWGLVDALTNEYGLGSEIDGWQLETIRGASVDGRYLVGYGVGPDSRRSAWLVDLGFTPVPEPSTYGVMAAIGLVCLAWLRRRRQVSAQVAGE